MPAPSRKSPFKPTLREWLLGFIFLSYVGSIVCNFYLLGEVDRNYSALIDHSVPVLNQLNRVTASAAYAMHKTYPPLFAENGPVRIEALENAKAALAEEQTCRSSFLKEGFSGLEKPVTAELRAIGTDYSRFGQEIIRLYAADQLADANQLREREFRPALERYLGATKELADRISQIGEKTNDELSFQSHRSSLVILSLAGWPVLVLSGIFITLVSLGLVLLLIMFKASRDIRSAE